MVYQEKMKSLTKKIFITIITGIIIIVFGAWGVGDMFSAGNKNVLAKIDNKKIYVNDYLNEARLYTRQHNINQINDNTHSIILNKLLTQKMYEIFAKDHKIKINDQALAFYIKNNNNFKNKNGEFSRVKYEKYLISNNLSSNTLEYYFKKELIKNLSIQIFINGVSDTKYHVNKLENDFLKQVNIEYFKLKNKNTFEKKDIEDFFTKNKSKFSLGEMRSGKVVELSPENLGYQKENDQFYKSINNIENDLINNLTFDEIISKYKLKFEILEKVNVNGINESRNISKYLVFAKSLFSLTNNYKTEIIEVKNKKYLLNLSKIEKDNETILTVKVEKEILQNLNYNEKLNVSKKIINSNNSLEEFNKLIKTDNYTVQNIFLKSLVDNQNLFNQNNMEKIFSSKLNQILSVKEKGEVFLIKIKKISKNQNKINNLQKILKNQTINEFQSIIIQDLNNFLLKKYPITINQKIFDQVKKSI